MWVYDDVDDGAWSDCHVSVLDPNSSFNRTADIWFEYNSEEKRALMNLKFMDHWDSDGPKI